MQCLNGLSSHLSIELLQSGYMEGTKMVYPRRGLDLINLVLRLPFDCIKY